MPTLANKIACAVVARKNCAKSDNIEWLNKHGEQALGLTDEFMPSGSGIDSGTQLDMDKSTGDKLVFHTAFHIPGYDWEERIATHDA